MERTETPEELLRAARRRAYLFSETDLVVYLKRLLATLNIALSAIIGFESSGAQRFTGGPTPTS